MVFLLFLDEFWAWQYLLYMNCNGYYSSRFLTCIFGCCISLCNINLCHLNIKYELKYSFNQFKLQSSQKLVKTTLVKVSWTGHSHGYTKKDKKNWTGPDFKTLLPFHPTSWMAFSSLAHISEMTLLFLLILHALESSY